MKPWQIARRQQRKHRSKMNQITENMKEDVYKTMAKDLKRVQRANMWFDIQCFVVVLGIASIIGFTLWIIIW